VFVWGRTQESSCASGIRDGASYAGARVGFPFSIRFSLSRGQAALVAILGLPLSDALVDCECRAQGIPSSPCGRQTGAEACAGAKRAWKKRSDFGS